MDRVFVASLAGIVVCASAFVGLADVRLSSSSSSSSSSRSAATGTPFLHVFDLGVTGRAWFDGPTDRAGYVDVEWQARADAYRQLNELVTELPLTDGRRVSDVLAPAVIGELVKDEIRLGDELIWKERFHEVEAFLPRKAIVAALGDDLLP